MVFKTTKLRNFRNVIGDRAVNMGTFTADGVTGGGIDHGLETCDFLTAIPAAGTAVVSLNGTAFPTSGSVVIICKSGQEGLWFAYGT